MTVCHLDTCECSIGWDDKIADQEQRRLSAYYVNQCSAHAAETAVQAHAHNVAKNVALVALAQALPGSEKVAVTDDDGAVQGYRLKTAPGWFIDFKNKTITVEHPACGEAVSAAIAQALIDHPVASLDLAISSGTKDDPDAELSG